MKKKSKFWQYFKAYKWSNIFAMIRNNRRNPQDCTERFDGKLVVLTGATSGIGYLTAKKYAAMGADLFCINRNLQKSEALKQEIEQEYQVKCDYYIADLSRLEDINKAAEALLAISRPIDVLMHNAGVYLTKRELTVDGLEKVLVVHYLSSFIINYRLIDKLKAQDHCRIILVSSEGHRFAAWGLKLHDMNWEKRRYSGLKSYGSAKTAQLLSMMVFDDLFKESGVTINAMHPGAVKTETGQENGPVYKWFKKTFFDKTLKPASISATALYYLGVASEMQKESGNFYNLTTLEEPAPPALDKEVAKDLWEFSLDLCKLRK